MKSRLVNCLQVALLFTICLVQVTQTFSQTTKRGTTNRKSSAAKQRVAIETAEVEGHQWGELCSAYLDDLAGRLRESPDADGLIIGYGPEGEQSGTGKYAMNAAKSYLTNAKGMDPNRIITVYGGPANSMTEAGLEFWLVPLGAKFPKPVSRHIDYENFVGIVGEGWGSDGPQLPGDGDGPGPGNVNMAAFAQVLRHQPESVGYLVVSQDEESGPGAWRRIGKYDVQLLKEYGIESDRLKIIYAGPAENPRDQFWVLPKGQMPPVKEAATERLGNKAVMIWHYYDFQLEDSKDQDFAFSGIADLLKEFPDAKVCYMITPPPKPEDDSTNKKETTAPSEKPKVDFNFKQLVENWKSKFITDLSISPDRIVVLFPTEVNDPYQNKLLSWIVPANAPQPSLPKDEEASGDDSEMDSDMAVEKEQIKSTEKKPVAIKLAELGDLASFKDYSAGLEKLATDLQQLPDARGEIFTYGPEGNRPGTAEWLLNQLKNYLKATGVDMKRIIGRNGGPASSVSGTGAELWIVPSEALQTPYPVYHSIDLASFAGKVGEHYGAQTPDEIVYESPSPGDSVLPAFAQVLRHQPESVGYLVIYQSKESAPDVWRRIAQNDIQNLKAYGVDADSLKIIYGGIAEKPSDQFWVEPKDAPPPVQGVAPGRVGKKAVKIQEFNR